MPLLYHPKIGDVLICEFPSCLREPEMIKKRPAIVVTREHKGRARLCTVVPLSTTEPASMQPYHVRIGEESLPKSLRSRGHWAKCDMLYTFCIDRLDRVRSARDRRTGRRSYETGRVSVDEIARIRWAILYTFSMAHS
ncbi:MAG TPA: type II toxin-antitoxin system PemK/MazF family toxin [Rhodanobacteraceae bacterium]|nr:type II toxin-antitoxin system PemK/MazF family toxin [Rhodanobacteraceae bacterium]